MDKNSTDNEYSNVLSVVLTMEEIAEVKALSDQLGISLSHMGRALIRLGLRTARNSAKNSEKNMLSLIKLGR